MLRPDSSCSALESAFCSLTFCEEVRVIKLMVDVAAVTKPKSKLRLY